MLSHVSLLLLGQVLLSFVSLVQMVDMRHGSSLPAALSGFNVTPRDGIFCYQVNLSNSAEGFNGISQTVGMQ